MIQQAVDNQYPMFEDLNQIYTQHDAALKLSGILNSDAIRKKLLEYVLQYTPERVRDTFYIYFLSHLGTTAHSNYGKMKYFGDLIRKVLVAHLTNSFPDQHTYLDKRIHSTGYTFAKTFKKTFNHQVVSQVRMKMIKELQKIKDIHKVDVVQIVKTQLATDIQNKMLQRSIVIGHGADISKSRNQHMKNRVQSQKLNRKNIINSVSQMRMINNQKQSLDKQSKKIIE